MKGINYFWTLWRLVYVLMTIPILIMFPFLVLSILSGKDFFKYILQVIFYDI
jgi:1-acyl-sn-glycerol-3-phosphate acyltransferase